jgi:DNA-binding transcriptional LysR family regulator
VKQCVVAGMGISALPSVAVESDVAAGNLVRLAWRPTFEVYTQIAWNDRRSLTPAMVAFIDTAKAAFSAT